GPQRVGPPRRADRAGGYVTRPRADRAGGCVTRPGADRDRTMASEMPRDIPVGNGNLLVTFDAQYQLRDIYFPFVGMEDHTAGNACRFGVWADGRFRWTADEDWERKLHYAHETLSTDVHLTNVE